MSAKWLNLERTILIMIIDFRFFTDIFDAIKPVSCGH